jgi:hypothetical protein
MLGTHPVIPPLLSAKMKKINAGVVPAGMEKVREIPREVSLVNDEKS